LRLCASSLKFRAVYGHISWRRLAISSISSGSVLPRLITRERGVFKASADDNVFCAVSFSMTCVRVFFRLPPFPRGIFYLFRLVGGKKRKFVCFRYISLVAVVVCAIASCCFVSPVV